MLKCKVKILLKLEAPGNACGMNISYFGHQMPSPLNILEDTCFQYRIFLLPKSPKKANYSAVLNLSLKCNNLSQLKSEFNAIFSMKSPPSHENYPLRNIRTWMNTVKYITTRVAVMNRFFLGKRFTGSRNAREKLLAPRRPL